MTRELMESGEIIKEKALCPRARTFLSPLFALALVGWIIHRYWTPELTESLRRLSGLEIAVLFALCQATYAVSGQQYHRLCLKSSGVPLAPRDRFLFPVAMNLFGLIVPFQGPALFSSGFLKLKYGVRMRDSLGMTGALYLLTTLLTGLTAVALYFLGPNPDARLLVAGAVLAIGPIVGTALLARTRFFFAARATRRGMRWLASVAEIAHKAIELTKHPAALAENAAWNLLNTSVAVVQYLYAARLLGIDLEPLQSLLVVLMRNLSLIVRFTPGNLGLDQVVSGLATTLSGGRMSDGASVSLFVSGANIVFVLVVGSVFLWLNRRLLRALRSP